MVAPASPVGQTVASQVSAPPVSRAIEQAQWARMHSLVSIGSPMLAPNQTHLQQRVADDLAPERCNQSGATATCMSSQECCGYTLDDRIDSSWV